MSRQRDYCFTINNYTEEDLAGLLRLETNPKVRYYIAGREVGENGTPHIQGYIRFNNALPFESLKKLIPRSHIEACKGTPQQNIDYCSKSGDFHAYGEVPATQKRKGELGKEYWETNKRLAIEGKLDEIDPKLYLSHYRTLRAIAADHAIMPLDNDDFHNEWYYGETGSGKSFKARSENPGHYLKMCNKWWDGYNNEEVCILEDFDKKHGEHLGHHLKIWGDRYAFPAEVKGSKVNLRPKKIIVTSNYHPSDIWQDRSTLDPILRRFKISHFQINLNQASP